MFRYKSWLLKISLPAKRRGSRIADKGEDDFALLLKIALSIVDDALKLDQNFVHFITYSPKKKIKRAHGVIEFTTLENSETNKIYFYAPDLWSLELGMRLKENWNEFLETVPLQFKILFHDQDIFLKKLEEEGFSFDLYIRIAFGLKGYGKKRLKEDFFRKIVALVVLKSILDTAFSYQEEEKREERRRRKEGSKDGSERVVNIL